MSQKNTCVNAKRLAIEQLILQLVGVLQWRHQSTRTIKNLTSWQVTIRKISATMFIKALVMLNYHQLINELLFQGGKGCVGGRTSCVQLICLQQLILIPNMVTLIPLLVSHVRSSCHGTSDHHLLKVDSSVSGLPHAILNVWQGSFKSRPTFGRPAFR